MILVSRTILCSVDNRAYPFSKKRVELNNMSVPKKYIHDRLVLLFLSISSFLVVLGSFLIILRLDTGSKGIYWAQYRSNLGISAYIPGRITDILAFIVFLLIIFGMNIFLSMKVYQHHRNYAVTVLSLGTLLILLTVIVSNLLLNLR